MNDGTQRQRLAPCRIQTGLHYTLGSLRRQKLPFHKSAEVSRPPSKSSVFSSSLISPCVDRRLKCNEQVRCRDRRKEFRRTSRWRLREIKKARESRDSHSAGRRWSCPGRVSARAKLRKTKLPGRVRGQFRFATTRSRFVEWDSPRAREKSMVLHSVDPH